MLNRLLETPPPRNLFCPPTVDACADLCVRGYVHWPWHTLHGPSRPTVWWTRFLSVHGDKAPGSRWLRGSFVWCVVIYQQIPNWGAFTLFPMFYDLWKPRGKRAWEYISLKIFIDWFGREERERHQYIVPLIYAFMGWLLQVPWLGIESTTLLYHQKMLSAAELLGQGRECIFLSSGDNLISKVSETEKGGLGI